MGVKFNPFTGNLDLIDTTAAAGADTQVQFNNGGSLAGSADLAWDDTAKELGVGGDINLDDGGTFATTLQVITPTANRTISFPDATGTVALVAGSSTQFIYNNAGVYAGLSTFTTDGTNVRLTGRWVNSTANAVSNPPVQITGTWLTTGGANNTTFPSLYISPAGTSAGTSWSTSGTGLGLNAPTSFAGNFIHLLVNGTTEYTISPTVFTFGDANDIAVGTTTGTKIGTATTQKIGFFNKTPVVQPASANQAALTNSTGGTADGTLSAVSGSGADTDINNNFTELHTLLNEIRTALVGLGIIKGAA